MLWQGWFLVRARWTTGLVGLLLARGPSTNVERFMSWPIGRFTLLVNVLPVKVTVNERLTIMTGLAVVPRVRVRSVCLCLVVHWVAILRRTETKVMTELLLLCIGETPYRMMHGALLPWQPAAEFLKHLLSAT